MPEIYSVCDRLTTVFFLFKNPQRSYFNRLCGATGWFLYPDYGNRRKRRTKRIAAIDPVQTGRGRDEKKLQTSS